MEVAEKQKKVGRFGWVIDPNHLMHSEKINKYQLILPSHTSSLSATPSHTLLCQPHSRASGSQQQLFQTKLLKTALAAATTTIIFPSQENYPGFYFAAWSTRDTNEEEDDSSCSCYVLWHACSTIQSVINSSLLTEESSPTLESQMLKIQQPSNQHGSRRSKQTSFWLKHFCSCTQCSSTLVVLVVVWPAAAVSYCLIY